MSSLLYAGGAAYTSWRHNGLDANTVGNKESSCLSCLLSCRLVDHKRLDGTMGRRVKPYIIDLGSGNGTYLNNQRIEAQRYYELREKDVLKFGFSSREYVLLHESSDTSEVDVKSDDEGKEDD